MNNFTMQDEFKKQYKRLNPAQKKAVDAIDGPVMVIAGPGTGKTTILTLRIANILRKTDTPAESILALTFTESGAKTMRKKLREIIGDRAYDVHIHTFHSFASWAIATYGDHFVHLKEAEQMTEIDAESLIRKILENQKFRELRPAGNPDYYAAPILSAISDMKKEAVAPEDARIFAMAEADRIKKDEDMISTRGATKGELKAEAKKRIEKCARTEIFADVYEAYEAEKRRRARIDYDDLIIELLVAMKRDELLLRLLQEQFLYILADEHQDTNDSQNLLLNMLADFFEKPNLFIVGDEKQAIYRFQGASAENFLRLKKIYGDMKVIELSENYRSHQRILDASYEMMKNGTAGANGAPGNVPRAFRAGRLRAGKTTGLSGRKIPKRPVEIAVGKTQADIENYLAESLRKILDGDSEASIAVIARTNKEAERAYEIIENAGLSASAEKRVDALSHPLGALFVELLRAVSDPSDIENLAKTVAAGLWNLPFSQSAELIRNLRSGKFSEAEKRLPALPYLRNSLRTSGAMEFLARAGEESGFIKLAAGSPEGAEVWRGIAALGEFSAREIGKSDAVSVIGRIFEYADSKKQKPIKISAGSNEARIKVMTAHSSKGLEFDYVFILYAAEESWMKKHSSAHFILPKAPAGDENERDARRLFYVAMTRARKHLAILFSGEGASGETLLPVRFLADFDFAGGKIAKKIEIKNAKPPVPATSARKRKESNAEKEKVEYAKRALLENGLSVTALNHFLKCPNEFFFLSVLKLPQAPNSSAEAGSAMHLALSRVWQKKLKSAGEIEKEIKSSAAEFLDSSLLPANEKEAAKTKLFKDAPAVAKALVPHFAMPGEIQTESWSKGIFKCRTSGAGGEIEIPIHGKLDAVLDGGKTVFVFDYKTKKAISENAIKGETKNSDGGYFRQLVFYKLLLSGDKRFKEKDILPALVFVSPDEKGRCPTMSLPVGEKDIESLKENIKSLVESVWSGEFLAGVCDDAECEWCELKQGLGDRV